MTSERAPFRKVTSHQWRQGLYGLCLFLECGHEAFRQEYEPAKDTPSRFKPPQIPTKVRCIRCTFPLGTEPCGISEEGYRPRFVDQRGVAKVYQRTAQRLFQLFEEFPAVELTREDEEKLNPRMLPYNYIPTGHFKMHVLLKLGMGELFGLIWKDIQKSLEVAYSRGHDDGKNLLGMLAAGKITIDELNKKAEFE